MVQVWMILLLGSVLLRAGGPEMHAVPKWPVAAAYLAGMLCIALSVHAGVTVLGRAMDRTGKFRNVIWADRLLVAGRLLAIIWHLVGVFVLGWVELVHSVLGNLVLVDELAAILPPVLVIVSGWWAFAAIEVRLRASSLIRALDDSRPVYPVFSRWSYLSGQVRHQVLLAMVPVSVALGWAEAVEFAQVAAVERGLLELELARRVGLGVHLTGLVCVFVTAPLLIRRLWSTVPLESGPLRDRLIDICRSQGVRARHLLVWRTHGSMANGAVLGFTRHFRYILLTDALLDTLREREVEAVMAHEVAHVRLRHIPWMLAAVAVGVAMGSFVLLGAWELAGNPLPFLTSPTWWDRWMGEGARTYDGVVAQAGDIIAMCGALLGALLVIGPVSRRFEWQADAFAAKLLSRDDLRMEATTVTTEAAHAMIGALDTVARFNYIPKGRFTWRHGSIGYRQARLQRLVGGSTNRLPIDRSVGWIKIALGIGVLGVLGIMMLGG
ncbi:MAG: M48 family metalloprotease [Phycisphaerales bacterium]|nr:M48 family metalloprotease [Phycisphaerales bacterium]